MDAVTYPDKRTIDFINRFLVAHRVSAGSVRSMPADISIQYTPTTIILDAQGREHHRIVGFLPPEEFVPSLILGTGKAWFSNDRRDKTLLMMDILLLEYPRSRSALEAAELKRRL